MKKPREVRGMTFAPLALILLLISTSFALLVAASVLRPDGTSSIDSRAERANSTVAQFYDAMNLAIASSDTGALDGILAGGYRQHTEDGTDAGNATALVGELMSLRQYMPGARYVLDEATSTSDGSEVTTRFRLVDDGTGAFLGLSLPKELGPGNDASMLEVLRIERGRVVERWRVSSPAARLQPIATATLPETEPGRPRVFALYRLTLAAGAGVDIAAGFQDRLIIPEDGPVLFSEVERKLVTVDASGAVVTARDSPPSEAARATLSQTLTLVPGQVIRIQNSQTAAAHLLLLARYAEGGGETSAGDVSDDPAREAARLEQSASGDATVVLLESGIFPVTQNTEIGIGRISIPSGATLTWPTFARSAMLSVESGALNCTGSLAGETSAPASVDSITLPAGEGAVIAAGSQMHWMASESGPAMVVVLTIESIPDYSGS